MANQATNDATKTTTDNASDFYGGLSDATRCLRC